MRAKNYRSLKWFKEKFRNDSSNDNAIFEEIGRRAIETPKDLGDNWKSTRDLFVAPHLLYIGADSKSKQETEPAGSAKT